MNHVALHKELSSTLSLSPRSTINYGDAIYSASSALFGMFVAGKPCDRHVLSQIMCEAFGGTDAEGAWQWKDAYEAVEVALVRFVQQYAPALTKMPLKRQLLMLERLHGFCPTHTRRSDESQAMQQFSTPMTIGLSAIIAADIAKGEVVLEPSAGTGMLAVLAQMQGASLVLNELSEARSLLLEQLFPKSPLSCHNAEYIKGLFCDLGTVARLILQ